MTSVAKHAHTGLDVIAWFAGRGIPLAILERYGVKWDEENQRIVIPVCDDRGRFLFNKYRRSPWSEEGPKYSYDKGATAALYGTMFLLAEDKELWIVEGELDVLRAAAAGIKAVSSTGGAGSFTPEMAEWVRAGFFPRIKICYDNDEAGRKGVTNVIRQLGPLANPAIVVTLPEWVGEHGDLTDYLNNQATFAERATEEERSPAVEKVADPFAGPKSEYKPKAGEIDKDEVRRHILISELVGQHTKLRMQGKKGTGKCPLHKDRTPSFSVDDEKGVWKCHGCGEGGDVFAYLMKKYEIPFKEALEMAHDLIV